MNDLLGRPLVLVAALAALSLLPIAFMGLTAFVKISTVLQIVKNAIGASSVPSSTIVLALSAVLTVVAMAPVGSRIAARLEPALTEKTKDTSELVRRSVEAVREPLREFLQANASPKEVERFVRVANERNKAAPDTPHVGPSDFTVLAPSFITTELTEAFSVGFLLFLPFVVIDIVIANVLLALGMQMMNPSQTSLPFKLLLFVAIDGWGLLAQSLIASYR